MSHRNSFSVLSGAVCTVRAPWQYGLSFLHQRRGEIFFATLILFTLAVSVHDAALVILHDRVIGMTEQNPVGRWLIELNHGDVWLFIGLKLLGTALCGATLLTLYEVWWRAARTAAIAVACFQLGLLIYLSAR